MHVDSRGVGAAIAMVSLESDGVFDLLPLEEHADLVELLGSEEAADCAAPDADGAVRRARPLPRHTAR